MPDLCQWLLSWELQWNKTTNAWNAVLMGKSGEIIASATTRVLWGGSFCYFLQEIIIFLGLFIARSQIRVERSILIFDWLAFTNLWLSFVRTHSLFTAFFKQSFCLIQLHHCYYHHMVQLLFFTLFIHPRMYKVRRYRLDLVQNWYEFMH